MFKRLFRRPLVRITLNIKLSNCIVAVKVDDRDYVNTAGKQGVTENERS